jgi:hypothetical protein
MSFISCLIIVNVLLGEFMPTERGPAKLTWILTYERTEPNDDSTSCLAKKCEFDAME